MFRYIPFILFFFLINTAYGQVTPPPGLVCETAIPLCNILALDNFNGELPEPLSYIDQQPAEGLQFCNNAGGTPENMYWFSFVAGSDSISLTITPFNCRDSNGVFPGNDGIQAGIFTNCAFDSIMDCYRGIGIIEPITLSANGFVPGQTYYFWVDGFNGNICNFSINVNYAVQPNPVPDLISFDQGNQIDTICKGTRDFWLSVQNYPLDIEFYWDITSTSPNFIPEGWQRKPNFDKMDFLEEGSYTFKIYATNRCDITDTITKTIVVEKLKDEFFSPIAVCENSFPIDGPLTEDPNGDGQIGWQGPIIFSPDLYTHTITDTNGCAYNQIVSVTSLPINNRANVTLVDCQSINYYGNIINSNTTDMPFTLLGEASNGCDSLVLVDAYILNIAGGISYGLCVGNMVTVQFNQNSISAPPGYTISYDWKWANGTKINDNDGIPSDVSVNQNGTVSLEITLTYSGKSCSFTINPSVVNLTDLRPIEPIPVSWTPSLCKDNATGIFVVNNVANASDYNWEIPPGASFIGNSNSPNVTIDFSGLSGTQQICVSAKNGCGESTKYCNNIDLFDVPKLDLALPDSSCVDSILNIRNLENNIVGATYNWNIGSNILMSGNLNSSNPINVRFVEGIHTINLACQVNGCSNSVSKQIVISKNITSPPITCKVTADSITFNWPNPSCNSSFQYFVDGVLSGTTSDNFYTATNLTIGKTIDFRLELVSSCPCSIASSTASCSTLTCDHVALTASADTYLICEDDWSNAVNLTYSVTGNLIGNGVLGWTGLGVSNDTFLPSVAGLGNHEVILSYSELGCDFYDTLTINLVKAPNLNISKIDPECLEDILGAITIDVSGGSGIYDYYMVGNRIAKNYDAPIGNHIIKIIDGNNCTVEKQINIVAPSAPTFEMTGLHEIYDNQTSTYTVKIPPGDNKVIDSVAWYLNGKLICRGPDCFTISPPEMEAGIYVLELLVYYKDCIIREEFELLVKATPKLFVSNAFTPNGDGQNDNWLISSNVSDMVIQNVKVFSRWGEIVYSRSGVELDADTGWDGSFKGQNVESGVYVYVITYIDEFSKEKTVFGDLTLLR